MRIARHLVVPMLLVLLGVAPAAAQIACGDTIAAGSKVVLTGDITGCTDATDPALTIVGPATVDMAGFRLICDGFDPNDPITPTGISLLGKGVKLSNGGVSSCGVNLVLGASGGHKVERFASERAGGNGVHIPSNKNKLKHVTSNSNGSRGFNVPGDQNKFENVAAAFNDNDGMYVSGDKNQVKRGFFASNEEGDGLEFDGDKNKAKDCFSANNRFEGFELDGDDNKLDKSIVTAVGDPNDVAPDPNDVGVEISGNGNQVKNVLANDNRSAGIVTNPSATNSKIGKNVALGNADGDLQDRTPGGTCGTNQWKKNTFGSAFADNASDPECIQ